LNYTLNLTGHKIAPAIAAGCPFVLKPASATPIGALIIGEVLAETDLPLAEVALEAGYFDQSHLTNILKRATGHTPAAYRLAVSSS